MQMEELRDYIDRLRSIPKFQNSLIPKLDPFLSESICENLRPNCFRRLQEWM